MPRNKSCSGILINKSIHLLELYFGSYPPQSVMCTPIENKGMILTNDEGKEHIYEQNGLNIWRNSFDYWLVQKSLSAGAKLKDETIVVNEVLGRWISESEGAEFWMGVVTELKNRRVRDILIVCKDGLTGFPETVRAVYPDTRVQLCIVPMVRNSTKFVWYRDLKKRCADLKAAYSAPGGQAGRDAMEAFGKIWNDTYPMVYQAWDRRRQDLGEFFNYPPDIRRAISTTKAVELLNYPLRKAAKKRPAFVNDEAVYKILYLAVRNACEKRAMPIRDWGAALNRFAVIFGKERVPF